MNSFMDLFCSSRPRCNFRGIDVSSKISKISEIEPVGSLATSLLSQARVHPH